MLLLCGRESTPLASYLFMFVAWKRFFFIFFLLHATGSTLVYDNHKAQKVMKLEIC